MRLGDLVGRKKPLVTGIIQFVIGSTFAASTSDMLFLVIGRAVQGLGGSLMIAVQAIVADAVPDPHRHHRLAPALLGQSAHWTGGDVRHDRRGRYHHRPAATRTRPSS